jgi:hypothetical protein
VTASAFALRAAVDNLRLRREFAGLPTDARSRFRRAKVGGEAGIRTLRPRFSNLVMARDFWC